MSMKFLDFEQPIAELEAKIKALRSVECNTKIDISVELNKLEKKSSHLTERVFSNLSDWQMIQLARHPQRPYTLDYIKHMCTDFIELHGDRNYADDAAIIGGMCYIGKEPVMLIGQQKGRTTKEKIKRNFGMPYPAGYRKALRLMRMAEKFNMPVVTLIDTPGAHAGINAEARGQSEAIATNLQVMSRLSVPIVCVVIGEGCSGGALGIGVGDTMLMMQYSYFATISPEGCATILWRSPEYASKAAEIMGITAKKLKKLEIVDDIIIEPVGGAHRDHKMAASFVKTAILEKLAHLKSFNKPRLVESRFDRIMQFGRFSTGQK
ncbi:MAG: acetyl-CoA carboxylase carboxyl transferase subunit alpha [Thiotrichales bacterium]|nr:MAG: acetyl-CoA carboxylase carboxyl transferase subunit alpha [Thiotrichales bacterium]